MASPIVVHQYAPAFGAPSGSPFCVKLTTWLNMADIDYTSEVLWDPRRAPQGKLPYITDGTTTVADSDVVIAHLREERGIALDEHLTPAQAAHAHALKRMIEESLYFVLVRLRWMTDDGWPLVKAAYFGAIPAPLRWIVPGVARRQVRRDLHGQGYGRHALSAVDAMGVADVDAIAAALGEEAFLFGSPSTIDAIAYAFLSALACFPAPSATRDRVQGDPRLTAYITRMRDRYWADA